MKIKLIRYLSFYLGCGRCLLDWSLISPLWVGRTWLSPISWRTTQWWSGQIDLLVICLSLFDGDGWWNLNKNISLLLFTDCLLTRLKILLILYSTRLSIFWRPFLHYLICSYIGIIFMNDKYARNVSIIAGHNMSHKRRLYWNRSMYWYLLHKRLWTVGQLAVL